MSLKSKVLTVNVTQGHINEGKPKLEQSCAVALSLKEIFPDYRVYVDDEWLSMRRKDGEGELLENIKFPREVTDFIFQFDKTGSRHVKPMTFKIKVPANLYQVAVSNITEN